MKGKRAENTLRRWRAFADWAAHAKGGRRACGLCKRAMQGMATVTIAPPWPTRKVRKRWLCSACWSEVTETLTQWEYERDNYDLPIDRVSRSDTTGGGHSGKYTKRQAPVDG